MFHLGRLFHVFILVHEVPEPDGLLSGLASGT